MDEPQEFLFGRTSSKYRRATNLYGNVETILCSYSFVSILIKEYLIRLVPVCLIYISHLLCWISTLIQIRLFICSYLWGKNSLYSKWFRATSLVIAYDTNNCCVLCWKGSKSFSCGRPFPLAGADPVCGVTGSLTFFASLHFYRLIISIL